MLVMRTSARNFDSLLDVIVLNGCQKRANVKSFVGFKSTNSVTSSRSMAMFISRVGRRYDPRHGPSVYKNKDEDNTRLEGGEFTKTYRDRDDIEVEFTDRRIDANKNPNSADRFYYHYYQSRQFARDVYSRHGIASGVNPSICFPDEKELNQMKQMLQEERSVSEMLAEIKREKLEFEKSEKERNAKINDKLSRMHEMILDWMQSEKEEKERVRKLEQKKKEYRERIRQHYGGRIVEGTPEFAQIMTVLLEEDADREKSKEQLDAISARKEAKRQRKKKNPLTSDEISLNKEEPKQPSSDLLENSTTHDGVSANLQMSDLSNKETQDNAYQQKVETSNTSSTS